MKKLNKSKEVTRLEEVVSIKTGETCIYSDATANELTACILDFINIVKNQQAERFHSGGVPFRDPKTGDQKFAKPITTTGTADIHATINSLSVKIEIKINDTQSQAQKEYQRAIERAGGIYFIARNFREFAWWYRKTFEK